MRNSVKVNNFLRLNFFKSPSFLKTIAITACQSINQPQEMSLTSTIKGQSKKGAVVALEAVEDRNQNVRKNIFTFYLQYNYETSTISYYLGKWTWRAFYSCRWTILTAACKAGQYKVGKKCEVCPKNTYSLAKATSCTPCPDNKNSPAGSKSEKACLADGKLLVLIWDHSTINFTIIR